MIRYCGMKRLILANDYADYLICSLIFSTFLAK